MRVRPKKLRQLRKDARLRQIDLAEQAGISTRYLRMLENGEAPGGAWTLQRLADALGVEFRELAEL